MNHRAILTLAAAAIMCLIGAVPAVPPAAEGPAGNGWPAYRGPEHNGISKETGWFDPKTPFKVVWTVNVGAGFSSMAVVDGKLYTMGNSDDRDSVFCFDAATGKELWKFSYDCPLAPKYYSGGTSATPAVGGGRVYTLSKSGHLFCIDAAGGKKIWGARVSGAQPKWGFAGSPLIAGDLLVLNVGPAGTGVNRETGEVVWQSGQDPPGYATPVPLKMNNQAHAAIFSAKSLVIVRIADGRKSWEYTWKTKYDVNAADPVIFDDDKRAFLSSGYNTGCALLPLGPGKPRPIWANRNMRCKMSGCVLWKGFLYGFDTSTLTCLDVGTGKARWTKDNLGMGSLIAADGKLIVLSNDGRVVIAEASPQGFRELGAGRALGAGSNCWTPPVLCGGLIYARNSTGDLACVRFTR